MSDSVSRYLNPFTDYGFKNLFGKEYIICVELYQNREKLATPGNTLSDLYTAFILQILKCRNFRHR